MKRIIYALIILTLAGSLFAEEGGRHSHDGDAGHHHDMFAEETDAILNEYRDRTPASLTFGEIEELSGALSVPAQKAAWLRNSAMASAVMPGLGQFRNGDPLSGTLFMLGDLAIVAGTALGMYFLLPPELQFGQLDYFNTPTSEIHAAWEAVEETATLADMWPIMGVATGGLILKHVISHFSSRHAHRLAMENIENGSVTFEPRVGFMTGSHGGMGLGFSLKY